jgi:hypothetical protein
MKGSRYQFIDWKEISTRMEQPSVLTQTSQLEDPPATRRHSHNKSGSYMRYFFAEDVSPDNHPVVELQRRACWVGIALITLSLSQIMNAPTIFKDFPFIFILVRCLAFFVLLLSFVTAWMAFRPGTLQEETKHLHRHPRRWQRIVLVSTLLLSIVGGFLCVLTIVDCFLPPTFSNDGTSLDTNAAELLLQGRNPYTDSSMLDVARQFQIQTDWTTPLRQGQFAGRLDYPTFTELQSVLDTDLKAGNAPEFESKVSYPALSFLTLVPFTWFKDYNVLPLYFLSYLLLIAIACKVARPELRPWVLLLAMTNVPMWSSTYGGNLDILYVLLIVIAWLLRAHRWRSALFLGLAIATKQIAWFFIPFYLIMTWRSHDKSGSYGLAESLCRLAIAGCVGLFFNLPFILWNPQAWLAGVLAPVADPMFPLGLGLIELSINHVLPFFPPWLYDVLEGVTMLIALAWYWCLCRKRPEAAMLLAFLPLVFAWRSLPSYFFCSIYPAFILMAAKAHPGRYTLRRYAVSLFFNDSASSGQAAQSRPAPVGIRAAISIAHFFHNMLPLRRFASPGAAHSWFSLSATWSEHEDDEPAVQGAVTRS